MPKKTENTLTFAVVDSVVDSNCVDYVGNQPNWIRMQIRVFPFWEWYTWYIEYILKVDYFKLNVFICLFLLGGGGGSVNSKCQLGSINLYNLSLLIYYACVCVCVFM